MLKLKIITLGKLKEPSFKQLEAEYLKRLKPFAKVALLELAEIPFKSPSGMEKAKEQEALLIEKHISKGSVVILLEEKGTLRNSKDFASFLDRLGSLGQELTFVVGSGAGLHPSLLKVSNYQISLSPLTFTHNFSRVLLEEQIYRAITILSGKAYHH